MQQNFAESTSVACDNNTNTKQAFVNPFADDDKHQHQQQQMGLKAASLVSMEGSPMAHEYQPTCQCSSCQNLLRDYTQYDLLANYVNEHLKYEDGVQRAHGFVPCVGGPYGNTATSVNNETNETVVTSSDALVFFSHNMTMKRVNPVFAHNAHSRYYGVEPEPYYANYVPKNNRGNGNGAAAPNRYNNNNMKSNTNSHYANGQQYQQPQRRYNNNNNVQAAFMTHQTPTPTAMAAPRSHQQQQQQFNTSNCHYSARDHQRAADSVVFTDAARLGM